jgi:glyoxylase-like metal-dependent hydrolase (beta-lactamase superfamily II)
MRVNYTTAIFSMVILLATNLANAHQTIVKPVPTVNKKYQLTISQIANNVFQHVSYKNVKGYGMVPANGLIVTEGKNAYIIDTPWTETDTEALVIWIKKQGFVPKSSISTHFHEDRAGGIPYLNKLPIDTYASELTNQLLAARDKKAAKHDLLMDKNFAVKQVLANGAIEVFYPGAGHSRDNIVVWLPEHELLFGGCFVKSLNSKTLGYTGDADIAQWPASMQKLIDQYPTVKQVVPGHGKTGDNKLLAHTQALALKVNAKTKLEK